MTDLETRLFALREDEYLNFQAPLLPTVKRDRMIGVRVPLLRKLAREWNRQGGTEAFLSTLPHRYYEEDLIHAFLIEQIKDFDRCTAELERFLPFIDNWGVCDSLNPKVLGQDKNTLLLLIDQYLSSPHPYTVRFGIKLLMTYFLDGDFNSRFLEAVAAVKSDEYYVNMMIAWYFATALAKQESATLPYLEEHRLSPWIHAKTIRKAIESYRVSDSCKAYLRGL